MRYRSQRNRNLLTQRNVLTASSTQATLVAKVDSQSQLWNDPVSEMAPLRGLSVTGELYAISPRRKDVNFPLSTPKHLLRLSIPKNRMSALPLPMYVAQGGRCTLLEAVLTDAMLQSSAKRRSVSIRLGRRGTLEIEHRAAVPTCLATGFTFDPLSPPSKPVGLHHRRHAAARYPRRVEIPKLINIRLGSS